MKHRVAEIHFERGTNRGQMRCSCSWTGEYRAIPGSGQMDTFSEHRRRAGAAKAYVTDALRTDAQFMPGRGRPQVEHCPRNHEPEWRVRLDGRRDCVPCSRDSMRELRRRQREARHLHV